MVENILQESVVSQKYPTGFIPAT